MCLLCVLVADQCVCLYVHRALFAYDGVTNKLKLADSGGKVDVHIFVRNYSFEYQELNLKCIHVVLHLKKI